MAFFKYFEVPTKAASGDQLSELIRHCFVSQGKRSQTITHCCCRPSYVLLLI